MDDSSESINVLWAPVKDKKCSRPLGALEADVECCALTYADYLSSSGEEDSRPSGKKKRTIRDVSSPDQMASFDLTRLLHGLDQCLNRPLNEPAPSEPTPAPTLDNTEVRSQGRHVYKKRKTATGSFIGAVDSAECGPSPAPPTAKPRESVSAHPPPLLFTPVVQRSRRLGRYSSDSMIMSPTPPTPSILHSPLFPESPD